MDKDQNKIKHLIAGGCSFTSNGQGGLPPTLLKPYGGNSYDVNPPPNWSWVGHLAQKLQASSVVNVASASHGNILTASTIIQLLSTFDYSNDNTCIVFNLTDPARLDIQCSYNDKYADSKFITWSQDLLPWSYLSTDCTLVNNIRRSMSIDQIEKYTTSSVELLINLLQERGFHYRFLLMNDVSNTQLSDLVKKHETNLIKLEPGVTMVDFCTLTNTTLSNKNLHPSQLGHMLIADQIYKNLP